VLTEVTAFAQRQRARLSSPPPDTHRYARAIASLAPDERRVLIARHEDLVSFEDIGVAMGISTGAARALFASAVMKLRVLLARV
jgi:DNA-directed RNA polymerase specialized sigma24 family protein